ncbi:hypothetical protein PybrP1_005324 [[Pythium] brassicae (nom. inval.)]|nr:hypothetical protein PybrP1_005324 [[Pythium] brassicae (nom. inval.)]
MELKAADPKPLLRVTIAPSDLARQSSRLLSLSRRQSRASSSSLDRRTSLSSGKAPAELEAKPSPTALRLKSLARVVRASQALSTLRVRNKYVIPLNQFAGDEVKFDLMAMIDDGTSPCGTAPWATDSGSKGEPLGAVDELPPTSPDAANARWKSAYMAVGQLPLLADEPPPITTVASPPKSPALRRVSSSRGSKPTMKRLGSIRGDVNVLLKGPVGLPPAQQHSPPPRAELPENLDARIFCARSLYKLSCQAGSELAIIQGGAISQIADFSDIEHPKLLRYCAATLVNLTTDQRALEAFVLFDGVQALLELSWAPCLHVKILCVTALIRISQHAAFAQSLARSKVIVELLSMLPLPLEQLQVLLVSCIANLIFHGHVFPDRVFLGEPHSVQNQVGVMSVVGQFASAPSTTQFAAEVLYNLSLYRGSCTAALRGGGADALHALAALVCKVMEDAGPPTTRLLSAPSAPGKSARPPWAARTEAVMRMLHVIAETLGNFSAFVEFHNVLSTHGMKTLSLLLYGALRDVGSKAYGATAEKRLKHTVVACSRALANFSASDELRKHAFTQEIVHMTTRLALLDRQRFASSQDDAQVYFHNVIRTIRNLSFNDTCTAYFMEFPQVLPLLHVVAIAVQESADAPEDGADAAAAARINLFTGEDVKEDALVTILNLAQQAAYSNDLVRVLDGKKLAIAAEDPSHSRRLKYIYSLVLCNLLFERRLQQIVYGELVVRSLVYGFNFFGAATDSASAGVSGAEQQAYKTMNLAFDDDQERFLAAICIMASELMDLANIECVVALILECLTRPLETAAAAAAVMVTMAVPPSKTAIRANKLKPSAPVRQRRIACYAAAALYTLARSSTQRGDTHTLVFSPEIEATLIAVCERTDAMLAGTGDSPSCAAVCTMTQAFCAASLYHMCASGRASRRIIQALIDCCNENEETLSLLACSASFAIISFTPEGRTELLASEHLAKALNRLGRASHPECQQYAAIAACNVSTIACIWTSAELKDFIVMALLRANSAQAKQIHAKTLSNLLSHLPTREKVVEDGVLYALMKLSQVMTLRSASAPLRSHSEAVSPTTEFGTPRALADALHAQPVSATDEVFSIGLQALFNLSCEHQYHQRLLSNGIMAYLAAPVVGRHAATSVTAPAVQGSEQLLGASSFLFSHASHQPVCHLTAESRRCAVGIICNLSSFAENHKELMNAQATDIIRKYVDYDIEARASAAMALRNLSCKQPWVEMLCERKTLHLLLAFTQCDHRVVRQFAVEALANCSLVTDSLHLYGELRVARAVLALLERVSAAPCVDDEEAELGQATETRMAALKCLHNLAFDNALAVNMIEENAILRLLPLFEHHSLGANNEACLRVAMMVNILAGKPRCAELLLRQRVVSVCALLHRVNPEDARITFQCVSILTKLSTYQQVQESLTETQAIQVIVSICSSACALRDVRIRECGAIAIRNLTLSVTEHLALFYGENGFDEADEQEDIDADDTTDGRRISRLIERHLLHGVRHFQRELDTIRVFRVAMVRLGIIDTLLRVYQHGPQPQACSTIDEQGLLVPSLLSILRLSDEELHLVRYECEKVSLYSPKVAKHGHGHRAECYALSRRGSIVTIGSERTITLGLTHMTPVTAATHCVKQTYRDQRWMAYLLKTTLSSSSMVPSLEKKAMKAPAASAALSSAVDGDSAVAASSENAVKPKGGYLLPVHVDKYMPTTGAAESDVAFPRSKAVILIGGPNQQGNHFRPLSLDLPKPLFLIAGREMLYFHVEACARVPGLLEILMIGSYDEGLFTRFFDAMAKRFNVQIRYLRESKALGTAGGLRFFKDEILQGNPASLFVLHCDICCSFPLTEMMHFHLRHPGACTVLGKRVFHDEALKYGCLVQDPATKEILHWAEKPETFVSDIINCGIYLFDVALIEVLISVGNALSRQRLRSESRAEANIEYDLKKLFPEFNNLNNLRLEQDVLLPLAGHGSLFLYETGDFWCQIKTPGMAVTCSELYMQRFRYTNPSALSSTGGKLSPQIEGNVVIDPSAQVHPSAKLGPNVSIAAGVTIGPGVRVAHSIILEGVTIKDHACVLFSVIGWNSIVGQWARVEGQPPNASQIRVHSAETALVRDVTIFGVSVVANPEIIIRNCVVLPHKTLTQSYHDEILL